MLTIEKLRAMNPGIIKYGFVNNNLINHPEFSSNQILKWIAKRGNIHDWAIYYALETTSDIGVLEYGKKLHDLELVKKLVPCTEEALKMYRR